MEEHPTYRLLRLVKNLKYRLVWQGALVGVASGLVVSFYRFLLSRAENCSGLVYAWVRQHPWAMVPLFAGLIVLGVVVGLLTKSEPMIKGSGIPQVEGQILGFFHISWWRVLIKKIIGGVLAIGAGLSLGREGPSIQLGAAAGEGVAKGLKRDETESRYLLTCGASAGLAAAFNAPLAGMMFALEEVHKNFSLNVLLSALTAAVTADVVSKMFFGMDSVFGVTQLFTLPLQYYWMLPLLGILLGGCGWLYNATLLRTQRLYGSLHKLPQPCVMIIPFVCAGLAGLLLPEILGGGHGIIKGLLEHPMAISYIALLLAAKFVFSMVSFGSGAPGGIFFPLLVLGALAGGLFGQLAVTYLGVDSRYLVNFLLLGMVGMFTGIVRAPVTGIILIVEMSGSLHQMVALAVVAVTSYLAADVLGSKPIYESLLENMRKGRQEEQEPAEEKVLLSFPVESGSRADGKTMKEMRWPDNCLAVSILRGEEELIPRGDTRMQAGDYVVIMCPKQGEARYREHIEGKFLKRR